MFKGDSKPLQKQSTEFFLDQFKRWYDPHGMVIENHKMVSYYANLMLQQGYTKTEVYNLVDIARQYHGLEKLNRK